jgi:ribonuclease HII
MAPVCRVQPRTHVGVDENGLGPRLGPLVVTAVSAQATGEAAPLLSKRPRGGLAARLGDSKRLVSFDDSALGEAWARALVPGPGTPEELVRALCLDGDATLRSPCPSHHERQCWGTEGEAFAAAPDSVAAIARDLTRLAERGVQVTRVRVAIVCAKRLNEGVARGKSRFDADLHAMERLVLDAASTPEAAGDVLATCGKVGGFDRYGEAFARFMLHVPLVEGRARSEYRVPGVGTVAFVRDAEERHPLVAMASLVGKWVRDLLMRRVVRFHQASVPDAPHASGYHDPVTTRFIAATALSRRASRVEDDCFVRKALPSERERPTSTEPETELATETPQASP